MDIEERVGGNVRRIAGTFGDSRASSAGRKAAVRVMIVVQSEAELFEVILALGACGCLAHLLHGRQKQTDENGDDSNHHQEFDERKTGTPVVSYSATHRITLLCIE